MGLFEKILSQYGFGVALSMLLAFFFYKILNYVMRQQDKLFEQAQLREKEFFTIIDGHKRALEEHTEQAMEHQKEIKTAFDYNRQEHKEMLIVLGRINGYKRE